MKRLVLNLDGAQHRSDVVRRIHALVDFPGWGESRLDDWLENLNAHSGPVPHLRSDVAEQFQVVVTDASDMPAATVMHLVRWVVRVNQRAQDRGYSTPILLSIE